MISRSFSRSESSVGSSVRPWRNLSSAGNRSVAALPRYAEKSRCVSPSATSKRWALSQRSSSMSDILGRPRVPEESRCSRRCMSSSLPGGSWRLPPWTMSVHPTKGSGRCWKKTRRPDARVCEENVIGSCFIGVSRLFRMERTAFLLSARRSTVKQKNPLERAGFGSSAHFRRGTEKVLTVDVVRAVAIVGNEPVHRFVRARGRCLGEHLVGAVAWPEGAALLALVEVQAVGALFADDAD